MESADRTLALPAHFTRTVRIDALVPADSPRLDGVDEAHVQRLSEMYATLPPILVHRPTMRVIDGMHRIAAASLKGLQAVDVQFFDGAESEVFLRSVAVNIAHGLPLSLADRKAAASRILASHPDFSDRAVAAYAGLDAKTVAGVRKCSTAGNPQLNTRTGSDGKVRPLDRTAERLRAAELMTSRPDLPLRAIVEQTGLSLGTAHDVRQRLLRGEAPVPPNRRAAAAPRPDPAPGRPPAAPAPQGEAPVLPGRTRASLETLRKLAGDPSLRHSESGRAFVRWTHTHFVTDDAWRQQVDAIPPHHTDAVAELALQCADTWRRFAEELSRRRLAPRPNAARPGATSQTLN